MINDIVIITDIYLDMDNMDNGISISDIHIIRIHTVYIWKNEIILKKELGGTVHAGPISYCKSFSCRVGKPPASKCS